MVANHRSHRAKRLEEDTVPILSMQQYMQEMTAIPWVDSLNQFSIFLLQEGTVSIQNFPIPYDARTM